MLPYHYVNMLEKYGGILAPPSDDIMKKGIEFFQIESRNPHLHEVKGDQHVKEMSLMVAEVIIQWLEKSDTSFIKFSQHLFFFEARDTSKHHFPHGFQ